MDDEHRQRDNQKRYIYLKYGADWLHGGVLWNQMARIERRMWRSIESTESGALFFSRKLMAEKIL